MRDTTRKKVNIDDLIGDMGAKQGERITETFNKSLLNTEQIIKVSLKNIYVSKQIRLKIHQDKVDEIVSTYPLRNYPEIRKVDPAIDGDSVPNGYEYVLLTGEHRYHALVKLNFNEHDFKFVPPSLIKSKADVIKYQFVENNIRADMHFIERAKTLIEYMEAAKCSKGEAGLELGISNSVVSRLLRVAKFFTDQDNQYVLDNNINSERVLVGITKLIELGHTDWLPIVKQYALNNDGVFDPELIYESTLARIIKDLTPPPTEHKPQAATTTSHPPVEGIKPITSNPETPKVSGQTNQEVNAETVNAINGSGQETINKNVVSHSPNQTSKNDEVNTNKERDINKPPARPPTSVPPLNDEVRSQTSLKLVANVLQQVLDGKEIEEILIELGPDLKKYISEEDGADIYAMIQALPFSN